MSDINKQMAPDVSPDKISKTGGVRRVNNMPMFFLGAVILAFVVIMALVAVNRAAKQNALADGSKEKAGNTSMYAKEIVGDQTSGLIAPARALVVPDMPTGIHGPVTIVRPDNLDVPPTPPGGLNAPAQDDEAMRIRIAKFRQLEEAAKSKTGVQFIAPRSSGSAPSILTTATPQTQGDVLARFAEVRQKITADRESDPTAAYQARLAQIRGMGVGGNSTATPQLLQTSANAGGKTFSQFEGNSGDRWKLDSQPEAPRSPFELRAGFVVPAILITGINSDLPGQIMAQVAQNVYDTPTGRHLLIPLGSRLIGSYASEVKFGQARVLVVWQRIVFPDGKAMDIGAMPGSDSAGYAGFTDQVNNRYLRLFGSAFLMSGVTAGITYSQRQNQAADVHSAPSASSALSEALGQQLGQVTAQLIAKNLSISPTIEIRPGYRFNVVVTKDLTLTKPYRSFDY